MKVILEKLDAAINSNTNYLGKKVKIERKITAGYITET